MDVELPVWLRLLLAILATWRITHLLANEDGPGGVIVRLRAWLGNTTAGRLMDCFACLAFWVAAPFACYAAPRLSDGLVIWLALSGAALLLERTGQVPDIRQDLQNQE